jgi:hypoxanthine-DNA glycosylase
MSSVAGFPPIAGRHPRILILGSMPGVRSLELAQYYGHQRNAFWPIMGALYGADHSLPYAERVQILKLNGVSVWDVLARCRRKGSLDTSIDLSTAKPNDLKVFLTTRRSIRHVFFNGAKAADLYRRLVLPAVQMSAPYLSHQRLPSTSPALAAMDFAEKLSRWSVIRDASRPALRAVPVFQEVRDDL